MNPKTDYSAWQFWFDLGQYIIAALVAFYIWLSNRDKARSGDIVDINDDIKEVETRITKLETGAISHTDLGAVYEQINEVSGQVKNLSGKMDGARGTLDIIQDHLLNNGGRK